MNTNLKISAVTLAFGKAAVAGQLNLICAMSLEIAPLIASNPKFRMAQYARDVEQASGYTIAFKTLENAGAVARKFNNKFGAQIGTYGDVSEANVLLFADFIREQVAKTTYNLTVMELSAWCDGKKSAADQRAEKAAAMLKEQADRMAAADAAANAVQAQGDKAPAPAPTESAPAPVAESAPEVPAPAPAEGAPAPAPAPTESAPAPVAESAPAPVAESAPAPAPKRDIYAEMLALADMLTAEDMEKFAAAMLARAAEMRAAVAPKTAPKSKSKSKRGASMAEQLEAIAA